jgi:hypothetical protein
VDRSRETGVFHPFDDNSPGTGDCGEAKNRCAYNKTRGYILGVEIACGDFSPANLADRLPSLTPKSGAGLWMVPFRGIPATDVPVPLDLLYLDRNCRVIETVEFFPTFRASPSSPAAASVLALPVHSVFASHTQPGDQVAFGHVEDVEHELSLLFGSGAAANAAQEALGARREPVASIAPVPVREEPVPRRDATVAPAPPKEVERPKEQAAPAEPAQEAAKPEPWKNEIPKKKSWLQRLLSPDPPQPRKNLRATLPGLTAYFFTGATPVAHTIRDISSTGLFVVTDERWYPGTLVQMTLKKTEEGVPRTEYSISLTVKALRWGNDGVGVAFILRDPRNPTYDSIHAQGATRAEMDQFLERIGLGQG